ncbi:helix-turn-helix domain-containing protein [Nocardia altamirensis]|uniref:helix-turn-helix domain-containing protein n=1 Tax=Nocardia altamirensis TaxID=472158 RepID=UPI00084004AA|nr:helix-turn-helix transcriptional regulator [Nocardia altamirensis]
MKWNLRMVAAQRDLWRPTQVLAAFTEVGFTPSLSKVAAMWSGTPVTIRLDDLDLICAALNCTVGDLLTAEPVAAQAPAEQPHAVGEPKAASPVRPTARKRSGGRSTPPN